MAYIAGHSFIEGPGGRMCQFCGRTWLSLVAEREYWKVGEMNIAHQGALSESGIEQLNAELDRIHRAMEEIASSQ